METQSIKIYQERDFGELIGAPITFFVQEFKLLAKSIIFFVGPFVLISAILPLFLNIGSSNDIVNLFSGRASQNSGGASLLKLLELLQNVMLYSTIGVYVKLYVQQGRGNFDISDIWKGISKFYFPVLGGQFLMGLMIVLGVILIIIPGIYIAVALSILVPIIILEEEGVGKSISRAFEIIKGSWWFSFGLFIVFGLLFLLALSLITAVFVGVFALVGTGQINVAISSTVVGLLSIILTSIMGLLPIFLYASLVSEKENPSLIERISQINNSEQENESSQEQNDDNKDDIWEKLINEKQKENTNNDINEDNKVETKNKENKEKNRFEDDDENNRFKPKY